MKGEGGRMKETKPTNPSFSIFILHPSSFILFFFSLLSAEPVVLNGSMLPQFIGTPIAHLRIVNSHGAAIPFQIDERTAAGDYICPFGESPNTDSGNGIFDAQDEIAFLMEDADSAGPFEGSSLGNAPPKHAVITMRTGSATRFVGIIDDQAVPVSAVGYIAYDHTRQYVRTPYFYARFGCNRFHFTKAGCMDFRSGKFVDLTNELHIVIALKALWGLLPINYTEENIVCHVARYKTGPIRLIRRGNFHLNLGLGLQGCHAIVYQMCYPQLVKVPVNVHLPIRFSHIFSSAYIEITPVINKCAPPFRFEVPSIGYVANIPGDDSRDTLIAAVPEKGYLVTDGERGYAWNMRIKVGDTNLLSGSGYTFRRPSKRGGMAECGFRLAVCDLPKGTYEIVNWVLFPNNPLQSACRSLKSVLEPIVLTTQAGSFANLLTESTTEKPGAVKR
jgi:hypothetical protein